MLLKDAGIRNGVLHLTADGSRNRNRSGAALLPGPVTLWCQDLDDDVEAKLLKMRPLHYMLNSNRRKVNPNRLTAFLTIRGLF